MKSVRFVPQDGRIFELEYQDYLLAVARHEFPEYLNLGTIPMEVKLQVDSLEDLFYVSHVTLNTEEINAIVFYDRKEEVWCFEHKMYVTEDRHSGLHG